MATPRVAAGALFFNESGHVLLVKPAYKLGWDIPGGYVERGESPLAACIREVNEELGLQVKLGALLVVDWAPDEKEGDKILFVFDGGTLSDRSRSKISFPDGELIEYQFISEQELDNYLPERLSRRVRSSISAKQGGLATYIEHGNLP
jgi:8-oxo-dGTP diphosphatase